MKVTFLRKGVFTTVGKSKKGVIQDLPNDEANILLQKGLVSPAEELVPANGEAEPEEPTVDRTGEPEAAYIPNGEGDDDTPAS